MTIIKALLSFFALLILSCSLSSVAGNGTGTDIGEAKISGTARLPGYITGTKVTVTLRKQDYIPFSVSLQNQQRTISGNDGTFTISCKDEGYYIIELFNKDSLCAIKRFYVSNNDSAVYLGDLLLDTMALFTGKIHVDGAPASVAKLLVMGMDNKVTLADDGSFSIHLPSGQQLFRIITDNEKSAKDVLFSDSNSGDTIYVRTTPEMILDDFENRDGLNTLTSLLGGGSWFAFTDNVNGGNSKILPTSDPGLVAAIDNTTNACNGGSLHCVFQIDPAFSAPFALIGVDISNSKDANSNKSWFDLSKMTAFTFMAKGTGTIYVQFTCNHVGASTDFTIYEIPVTLSSEWKKHAIYASDIPNAITSTASSIIPWSSGCSAVSNINFLAKKSTDLWLDDLTFEGMNATDFLK